MIVGSAGSKIPHWTLISQLKFRFQMRKDLNEFTHSVYQVAMTIMKQQLDDARRELALMSAWRNGCKCLCLCGTEDLRDQTVWHLQERQVS